MPFYEEGRDHALRFFVKLILQINIVPRAGFEQKNDKTDCYDLGGLYKKI